MSAVVSKQVTDPVEALAAYLKEKPDGEILDYVLIESETGQAMSQASGGRDLLRRALRRLRRPYRTYRGSAIILGSPDNAAEFARNDLLSLGRKATSVRRKAGRLVEAFGSAMRTDDLKYVLGQQSAAGAIQVLARDSVNAKTIEAPPKPPSPGLPFRKK